MSDSGTSSYAAPLHAFLGSAAVIHFPLGNLRVSSPDHSGDNADIQHRAAPCPLRHARVITSHN